MPPAVLQEFSLRHAVATASTNLCYANPVCSAGAGILFPYLHTVAPDDKKYRNFDG